MKRYASHFLFLSGYGYYKQYVIETEDGCVVRMFPLTEEVENVEWLPGAIILLNEEELKELNKKSTDISSQKNCSKIPEELLMNSERIIVKFRKNLLTILPLSIDGALKLFPVYFSKFDISTLLPVAGTPHKLLP